MDEQRFDQFSRRLGSSKTRRQALRAFAGAVVASVVGVSAADAQSSCVAKSKSCQSDGECCDGMVCEWGVCKPGCRIDGEFAHPKKSPAGNTCVVCQPEISTTAGMPTKEGKRCWSGDPYAGETTCQNGVCASDEPISCPPLTACHLEGTVNPANGLCEYPPAPEGTLCGAAEMCHGGFYSPAAACDGTGHCIGGGSKTVNCAPYPCAGSSCATSCATDGDCTNGAICCNNQCVYLNTIDHCGSCGDACGDIDSCTPASCDDGVCNQTSACTPVDSCTPASCDDGVCNQTSACTPVDSCTPASCDDGFCNQTSACTGYDTCGGGGSSGLCGCTVHNPICQETCYEGNGCGGTCAGQAATTPAIAITFKPSSSSNHCHAVLHLSGFTGCTTYSVENMTATSSDGSTDALSWGGLTLATDVTGSSESVDSDLYIGRALTLWYQAQIGSVSSAWTPVSCQELDA